MGEGHDSRETSTPPPHLRENAVMAIVHVNQRTPQGMRKMWVGPYPCRINFRQWDDPIRFRGVPNRYDVIAHIWHKPLDGGRYGDPYEYQVWIVPHTKRGGISQIPDVAVFSLSNTGTVWVTVTEDLPYKEACEFRSAYFQFIQ